MEAGGQGHEASGRNDLESARQQAADVALELGVVVGLGEHRALLAEVPGLLRGARRARRQDDPKPRPLATHPLRQADVRIDIVFSDVNMPGSMDGFGLAQWVRRERPWLKVILTSGAARTAKEAGHLCEHGPILAKPYDHAELERHIRSLLAR